MKAKNNCENRPIDLWAWLSSNKRSPDYKQDYFIYFCI